MNNNLSGSLPSAWSTLTMLKNLDLKANALSGTLPPELGRLTQLQHLRLQDNRFVGEIPSTYVFDVDKAQKFYFDGNRLSGTIPSEMVATMNMAAKHQSKNEAKGCRLSGNRFRCPLPSPPLDDVCSASCCPVGFFSIPPATDCFACPNTTAKIATTEGADCFVCDCGSEACPKGRYAASIATAAAATRCFDCPGGQYQDGIGGAGVNSCKSCPPTAPKSHAAAVSVSECAVTMTCPAGQEALSVQSWVCQNCSAGHFKPGRSTGECQREDGTTSVVKGVKCAGGGIEMEKDFFVDGSGDNVSGVPLGPGIRVLKCRGTGVCESVVNKTSLTVKTRCIPPAAGALCGACEDQHAKGQPGSPCVKCSSQGGVVPPLTVVGAIFAFGVLYRQIIKAALSHARKGQPSRYMTFSLLKIGMAFLFKTSLLSHFQLDWGALLGFIFRVNSIAGSGDATKLASAECFGLDLHGKVKLLFAAPFVVLILPLPMLLKGRFLKHRATVFGVPPRDAYWASVLVAWWLLHPAVLSLCIASQMTLHVGGKEYVVADLSIKTTDPSYQQTRRLAIVLMATFVPALPLCVFSMLHRWRNALRAGKHDGIPPSTRIRLFYFYGSYTAERYYWEVVVFTVRTVIALLAAVSSTSVQHGMLQLVLFLTTWVALLNFLAVFKCMPYVRPIENSINNKVQAAFLALLLCALGLSMEDTKQEIHWFEPVLLGFCAALLIGTMIVITHAFLWQVLLKRGEKMAEKM
eukprot:g6298.t1